MGYFEAMFAAVQKCGDSHIIKVALLFHRPSLFVFDR